MTELDLANLRGWKVLCEKLCECLSNPGRIRGVHVRPILVDQVALAGGVNKDVTSHASAEEFSCRHRWKMVHCRDLVKTNRRRDGFYLLNR